MAQRRAPRGRIGLIEPAYGGKRIEKKMRLDLRLHDLQACLRHLLVETHGIDRLLVQCLGNL